MQIATTTTTSGDDVRESGKALSGRNGAWTRSNLRGDLQNDRAKHLFSEETVLLCFFYTVFNFSKWPRYFAQLFMTACCLFLPSVHVCCASSKALKDTQVHVEAQSLTVCLDCSHRDSDGFIHLWEFSWSLVGSTSAQHSAGWALFPLTWPIYFVPPPPTLCGPQTSQWDVTSKKCTKNQKHLTCHLLYEGRSCVLFGLLFILMLRLRPK